jgi:hypothetical protein
MKKVKKKRKVKRARKKMKELPAPLPEEKEYTTVPPTALRSPTSRNG